MPKAVALNKLGSALLNSTADSRRTDAPNAGVGRSTTEELNINHGDAPLIIGDVATPGDRSLEMRKMKMHALGSTHSGGELRKKLEVSAQEEEEKPLPKKRGVSRKNSMRRESFANIEPLMIDTAKSIQQRDFLKGGNS